MLSELINKTPEIVTAAASSILGILALCILGLALLAYLFFRDSTDQIRTGIFVLLFAGVVAFGSAVINETKKEEPNTNGSKISGVIEHNIEKAKICYDLPKYSWSSAYKKSESIKVHEIRCGSKDVKDPSVCGFGASITIPIKHGNNKRNYIEGQEKYLKTVSNTCSPSQCCNYDMDNKEQSNYNGNYMYYWRHRSCATSRTITIEVKRWEKSGITEKKCEEYTLNGINFFEFSIPKDAMNIKLYPIAPDILPPEKIQNVGTLLNEAYAYECNQVSDHIECIIRENFQKI